jgi:SAM-dependent methyltransferase
MARYRFDLTEEEQALVARLREEPITPASRALMLARAPRLIPEVVVGLVRAAKDGLRSSDALVWLLDGERFRRAIPDVARSVGWTDERPFVELVAPRLSRQMRALEIGCGDGRVARHVAPLVGELVCTDVSPTMLREASANLAGFGNVAFRRIRGFALQGFDDGEFDVVYARGVLSTLDINQALALLDAGARVLREGGLFAADVYMADRPENMKERLLAARDAGRRNRFTAGQYRPYFEAEVEALCRAVGLADVTGGYDDGEDGRRGNHIVVAVKSAAPIA